MTEKKEIVSLIEEVFHSEVEAIEDVESHVDCAYTDAVELILSGKGRVIFTGVGKSGHIGSKLAATYASLGIPSFFMHSTEAVHGDLGMVTKEDIVIAISNSGETNEVLRVIPSLKAKGVKIISITGNRESTLAKASDIPIEVHVDHEADKFDLAPSNSSTATLVAGDAIGLTLSRLINFSERDFGLNHPGGALGKRLVEQGVLKEI
ncbi:SIS domain-containing protein [Bifidobacterium sp. ESL0732]|uniref:KpsF/GutQ family sugar-phosphate isomerase n=1 Tax=Bifidobacterium sp. ESL0732 TaxID=2983222 RepID=UPI0023F98571|nr:SIS domain-containing protein [Bifidobacterium sp. ESL0732]WEV64708.1 SIS domain-containing protein [Bifidobacterium sp. ESL0732]